MKNLKTATQAPSAEQHAFEAGQEEHNAIQAVIDAHSLFAQIFGENAKKVWQDLLNADYPESTLNKLMHLK